MSLRSLNLQSLKYGLTQSAPAVNRTRCKGSVSVIQVHQHIAHELVFVVQLAYDTFFICTSICAMKAESILVGMACFD